MATIDEIVAAVEATPIATDGTLTLRASDLPAVDVMTAFFTNVVGERAFPVRGAALVPGQSAVVIKGQSDFLGYRGLGTTLTFAAADGHVVVTLVGAIASTAPITLPVASWVKLDAVSVITSVAEPFQLVSFQFSASVLLSGEAAGSVPVEVTYTPPSQWVIGVAEQPGTSVTAEQLVELIGGHGLASFLPQQLVSLLDGLALADLGITFDTGTGTVNQVTAAVTVTNGWPVAPGINLAPGLTLSIGVANPGDASTREFTGVALGTFDIDGVPVPVFIQADVTSQSTSWLVGLNPASDGVKLPRLSGLFTLAGGPGFADSLPSGLSDLPGIQISQLLIGFTLGPPARLQQARFAAETTSSWPVVEDFLTVEELSFQFQLVGLSDGNRGIGCDLACIVELAETAWLYFEISKDPGDSDWTLSGGLPPGHSLNLTDLVAKLLSRYVTLPAHAPQIVLDSANVTVVPGSSVTLTAGSVTPWTLFGPVKLDAWTLSFRYDNTATQKFTGSLDTTLTLAGVPVMITAGLDATGTWSFLGRTAPDAVIAVGDLISDLGNSFGVPDIPAQALHGLTIAGIEVDFAAGSQPGSPSQFHFGCTGSFAIAGGEIDALLDVTLHGGASGYTGSFTGDLTIKTGEVATEQVGFTLVGGVLTAKWTAGPGGGITLDDLAAAFGFSQLPQLPGGVEFGLAELAFSYDFGTGTLTTSAATLARNQAELVSAVLQRDGQPHRVTAFAVDLKLGVTLADLPLVGDKLPDADQLGLPDLGCWVLSDSVSQDEARVLNGQVPPGYPKLPDSDLSGPVLLVGQLRLGTSQVPLELDVGSAAARPASLEAGPVPAAPPSDGTKWFDVNRTFGVFSFQRIGVQYNADGGGTLFFLLDASIAVGPLTFSTEGLGIGSPLTHFTPKFHLSGLGLAYSAPPLAISGALFALPAAQLGEGVSYQYDGLAVVQAQRFGLAAIGSYAKLADGAPSLFVFAQLRAPLGGPPALFVTALMGGFGYNRSLVLPGQDEVLAFPLLALGAPPGPGQPAPAADPAQVLRILEGTVAPPNGKARSWITPRSGDYWLAVGLEFTSFEIVTTQAMLVAEFGTEFALALLGLSTLRLPQGAPDAETYAFVELELEAVLKPAEGQFGLTAVLSPNSYLLAPAAKLTGGFAFYLWFGDNPNAGQFVITIGGYHPAFSPPAYFPQVPKVGLNWAVSDLVSVKGSGYFALTTSCVMAGGGLEVVFSSGKLRAWFTAQADLLVSWNPFSFLADIGVSIGVAYTLDVAGISKTLSLSAGASVRMSGPPTAGTVTVSLYVVSFTVEFGAKPDGAATAPLDKAQFADLIPAAPVKVTVTGGLAASADDPHVDGQQIWIVRTGSFAFTTESALPAATVGHAAEPGSPLVPMVTGGTVDVRPMNLRAAASVHTVTVQDLGTSAWLDLKDWSPATHSRPLPASLWGTPLTTADGTFTQAPQRPSADVIPAAPVGASFSLPGPAPGATTGRVSRDDVAYEPVAPAGQPDVTGRSPLDAAVAATGDFLPRPAPTSLAQVARAAAGPAASGRAALLGALARANLYNQPGDSMTALAAAADHLFTDPPLLVP